MHEHDAIAVIRSRGYLIPLRNHKPFGMEWSFPNRRQQWKTITLLDRALGTQMSTTELGDTEHSSRASIPGKSFATPFFLIACNLVSLAFTRDDPHYRPQQEACVLMPDSVKQFLLETLSGDNVAEQAREILTAYKRLKFGEGAEFKAPSQSPTSHTSAQPNRHTLPTSKCTNFR